MAIDTTRSKVPFRLTNVSVRPVASAEEEQWDALMEDEHPLGNARFAGHRIKYVAEHRGRAVALLCLSGSAYHLADRDRWLGWSPEQRARRRCFVVQNSRFLVLPNPGVPRRNLASRVLGLCLRRAPDDWRRRFGFAPVAVETFVDNLRFRGTCYAAAGWTLVGRTRGFRRDGREFYTDDSHPKDIWMKELRPDGRAVLRAAELPADLRPHEKDLAPAHVVSRIGCDRLRSLFEMFADIDDPRGKRGRRYPLACVLGILTCASMAGCSTVRACAEFGANLGQRQLRSLRCWRNPKTGRCVPPRFGTYWRIAAEIDPEQLERAVFGWLTEEGIDPEALAVDGKSLRATLRNADGGSFVVSAFSHDDTPPFWTTR